MSSSHLPWLAVAEKHIGLAEIPGVNHHPLILSMWKAIKRGGIQSDEVPWCAAFVGYCLENVGIVSSRFEAARSYMTWGQGLAAPLYGCIGVFNGGPTRPGLGHTGFIVGRNQAGLLMVLGGNQGNQVCVVPINGDRLLASRWPNGYPLPAVAPLPIILSSAEASRHEA